MQIKKSIAIIEDDEPIRLMYMYKLQSCGYNVVAAANGRQGFEIAEKHLPDLILLDLMMPEMNGDEMLEAMRKTDWGAKIKVIVLTNLSKDEAPHGLRFLSVDRYIVKAHHTPSQVMDIVKDILK